MPAKAEHGAEDPHLGPSGDVDRSSPLAATGGRNPVSACCPRYHEAVELIGRRWTGAIVAVLIEAPEGAGMRFSQVAHSVPELSDRLLSARMRELEARGLVERTVHSGPPVRVEYALTEMGRALEPALRELGSWAREWLRGGGGHA
jgi:DNA-binding HxlR family transcriptional regulator